MKLNEIRDNRSVWRNGFAARSLNYPIALTLVAAIFAAPLLVLTEMPAHAGTDKAHNSAQKGRSTNDKHDGTGQVQNVDHNNRNLGAVLHDDKRKHRDVDQRDGQIAGRDRTREKGMSRFGNHFDEHRQASIREYYAEQISKGRCPPGLAKKDNGCLPPGQAKKWAVGQQLPSSVVFHNLPSEILGYLGAPPKAQRFVRVDNDILLISSVTGLVIDAIQSLGE